MLLKLLLRKIALCFILLLSSHWLFAADQSKDKPLYPCSYEHPASAGACATTPVAIHTVLPEYTEEARQAKLAGQELLSLIVGKKGLPSNVRLLKPLGKGLDEQTIAAVEQWKFIPGTYKGHTVPVVVTLSLYFDHCNSAADAAPAGAGDAAPAYRRFPAPGTGFSLAEPDDKSARKIIRFYDCGSGIGVSPKMACAPELISAPQPMYTEAARQAGLEGTVLVSMVVNKRGSTQDVHVVQSIGKAVDEPAVEAVKKWKFRPALYNDEPVSVSAHAALEFGACRTFTVSAGQLE